MLQFQSGQLHHVMHELQRDQFCGVAKVELISAPKELFTPHVLAFHNGAITYGGSKLPNPEELSQELGRIFNINIMDAALRLANKKVKNKVSLREYLEFFVQLELVNWEAITNYILSQVVLMFDQLLPYAGNITLDPSVQFDLCFGEDGHGLDWKQLRQEIDQRQQGWASLSPAIPSMYVMPKRIEKTDHTDLWVRDHLEQWADGSNSLLTIATQIGRDPLELAHSYLHWAKMGWIIFNDQGINPTVRCSEASKLDAPTILSVDDSPVVQTMIKRAIGDRYHVLLANNAVKALNLLNNNTIKLLLLDVTMPDIDGLELCRTIRQIKKFRDIPIIMLTAKDGILNKVKGQMAGSTHYLTKPIDHEILLETLEKYVPFQAIS